MSKTLRVMILFIFIIILVLSYILFVGEAEQADNITWGVTFCRKHSQFLGLDWKENYLALLDDLKAKDLKLIAYWDLIETQEDNYDFSALDWQLKEAEKRGAKVLLTIGRKVPRWPECHEPEWLKTENMEKRNEELFEYLEILVKKYRDNEIIWAWQVENEPFFPFGECPEFNIEILKKEIELVKNLDNQNRPIIITDSGEFPLWFKVAKLGDIVGHTLYRRVWFKELKMYITYPFSPAFYARKTWLIKKLYKKEVLCSELQAEPWGEVLLYDLSLEEQKKTMDLNRFKKVIEFAQNTGGNTFYLWGPEWWYWLKERTGNSEIWEEAKKLWQ
jgi:hypothetical protein